MLTWLCALGQTFLRVLLLRRTAVSLALVSWLFLIVVIKMILWLWRIYVQLIWATSSCLSAFFAITLPGPPCWTLRCLFRNYSPNFVRKQCTIWSEDPWNNTITSPVTTNFETCWQFILYFYTKLDMYCSMSKFGWVSWVSTSWIILNYFSHIFNFPSQRSTFAHVSEGHALKFDVYLEKY